jgi:hypothetical protein
MSSQSSAFAKYLQTLLGKLGRLDRAYEELPQIYTETYVSHEFCLRNSSPLIIGIFCPFYPQGKKERIAAVCYGDIRRTFVEP